MNQRDGTDGATPAASKGTGELKPGTGSLAAAPASSLTHPAPAVADLAIYLTAMLGAIALGLGISDYFFDHPYVCAYLIAYAGFVFAEHLVGTAEARGNPDPAFSYTKGRIPILILFFAAPFERTYIYGGDAPGWAAALGLLLELLGLWLALGARIQWSYFAAAAPESARKGIISSGFYRRIRHPIYAGSFLVLLAWPFEYGSPITFVVVLAVGVIVLRREIAFEERALVRAYGEEYAAYQRTTDSMIPGVW
ncbi:MAG TPA: isoprenylcysteine carboxylmethyltransferase family protein [Candidatus Binataceae bacterium]|nr:isoprenylcysteine carboxylmethyltransferase family protein [Candidatus Binataceae bacterium]